MICKNVPASLGPALSPNASLAPPALETAEQTNVTVPNMLEQPSSRLLSIHGRLLGDRPSRSEDHHRGKGAQAPSPSKLQALAALSGASAPDPSDDDASFCLTPAQIQDLQDNWPAYGGTGPVVIPCKAGSGHRAETG